MHGACIVDEVAACPRIAKKEFRGKHVSLQSIARGTGGDHIAGRVRSTLGERMNVVERGALVFERSRAVHAATSAVSQRGELDRSLVLSGNEAPEATQETSGCAWGARKRDAMTVSSGQSHLARKDDTPRRENSLTRGVAH